MTAEEAIKVAGDSIIFKADGTLLDENNMIKIGYQKEDGSFSPEAYCSRITIQGSGTYQLRLVKDTGLHYLES